MIRHCKKLQRVEIHLCDDELYNSKDEFLCEASEEDADAVGELMGQSYEYASNEVFKWYTENEDLFPNEGAPNFAFNLNAGFKKGKTYLETH